MPEIGALVNGKRLITNVEIFHVGTHVPGKGAGAGKPRTWTREQVAGMAKAFNAGIPEAVYLKMGHTSAEFNAEVARRLNIPVELVSGDGPDGEGQIALGQVKALRMEGDILLADFLVPDELASVIGKGYHTVSVELLLDYQGYSDVLSAVALLGAGAPAVKNMEGGLADMAILADRKAGLVLAFTTAKPVVPVAFVAPAPAPAAAPAGPATIAQHMGQVVSGAQALMAEMEKGPVDPARMETQMTSILQSLFAAHDVFKNSQGGQGGPGMTQQMTGFAALAVAEQTEELKAQMTKMQESDTKKDTRIATLERQVRISFYEKAVAGLQVVEGTPTQLATKLADLEEKLGAPAAQERLKEWQGFQKMAQEKGLFAPIGTARVADQTTSGVEAEIKAIMSEAKGLTREQAIAKLSPASFRKYQDHVNGWTEVAQ